MSLTVPTAGVSAGRAAQPQFETPQTGAALAQFGEALKGLGDKMEARRLDNEMGQLQLGMTRDLNQLRLKYEAMGDPDAINGGWGKDLAALRAKYTEGNAQNGRPMVDPKIADQFGLAFDDLAERHAFALGTNVLALQQSQRVATRVEYEATLAQAAANSDPATRETLYAQNDQSIDALEKSGAYTPEMAAAKKLEARQTGDFDALTRDLGEDVETVREGLEGGAYPHLTPDQRTRAEAALASADEKARLLAEKATADKLAGLKTQLSEGIKLVKDGRLSTAESLVDNPVMQAEFPELVGEMRGAIGLRKAKVDINRMTLTQLQATAKQWSSTSFSADYQADGLRAIEARAAEVKVALRTDPVALWKAAEMGLSEIDFSSPETMAQGLVQRTVDVGRLVKSGHLSGGVFLDKDEAAQVKEMTDVTQDPAQRLDLAMALQGTFGAADASAVKAITGDETLSGVAAMLGAGAGNKVLARQILAGQRIAAEKGLPLPSEGAWREVIGAQFGSLFDDGTVDGFGDENPDLQMLGSMAFGLYVQRKGAAADLSADALDATLLEQVFHEVAGGTGTFGSGSATGGIQMVNGHKVILPPGMTADEIENSLATLKAFALFDGVAPGARSDEIWRSISLGGNTPRVMGEKVDLNTFNDLSLRPADNGAGYNLVWFNRGAERMEALQGGDGKAYVLDLDALIGFDIDNLAKEPTASQGGHGQ